MHFVEYCANKVHYARQTWDKIEMEEIQTVNEEHQTRDWHYAPDKWLLIKIRGTDPHYRVFGSWSGGYLDGDSWRLNSGITSVEEVGDYYYFHGNTGSVYKCHKEAYGATVYGYSVAQRYVHENFSMIIDKPENIMELDYVSN